MQKSDGMNYAPKGKSAPVVTEGQFVMAAIGLDHGHIYAMCNGLTEAGARLKWVYDHDQKKYKNFVKHIRRYRQPKVRKKFSKIQMLGSWQAQPFTSKRCDLGLRVFRSW